MSEEMSKMSKVKISFSALRLLNRVIAPLGRIGGVIVGKMSSNSRYLLAILLILIAGITSWMLSKPRSAPDLLAPVLSLSWWLNPLERGAVLRLPIINTDTKPDAYWLEDGKLYLRFKGPQSENVSIHMDADGNVSFGKRESLNNNREQAKNQYGIDFKNASGWLEWNRPPFLETKEISSGLIQIAESWALSNDLGIVLGRKKSKRWIPIAVTKTYTETYLARKEPAYEFDYTDNKIRWRKKKDMKTSGPPVESGSYTSANPGSNNQWSEDDFHRAYPAPLAYVIIGVLYLMVLMITSARAASIPVFSNNIVEHFASDAPITKASSDCLGFNQIARSISQFLRNEKTAPPLTIAVTGQWGSGKSSLMKLLASDLKAHRIQPVWLNAWHHQNESQFLYGLLNAIRQQGIPSMFSGAHLLFRIRLLTSRIKQEPFYALILVALLAIPIGFLSAVEIGTLPTNWVTVWLTKGNWAVLGTTALPFFWGLFNLSGEKLTKLAAGKFKQRMLNLTSSDIDLRSAAGLRDQFVQEFNHFCNGMGISTLTVFIDDLDRCCGKRVMDVLETVNFLVSNGKCIIIFGMDREPVERAVTNYYSESYKHAQGDELIHFARRYLEKLVNIEVPVPVSKGEQAVKLVTSGPVDKLSRNKIIKLSVSMLFLAVFSFSFFYVGTQFGNFVSKIESDSKKGMQVNSETEIGNAGGALASNGGQFIGEVNIIEKHEPQKAYAYIFGPVIFLFILAGILAVENHRQRSRVLVFDSKDFTSSIQDWMLFMGNRNSTPRRIKRFVNRTRFLTMRLRNSRESDIIESDLVTMAGLHEQSPELLGLMEKGEEKNIIDVLDQMTPENDIEQIKKMVHECRGFQNFNIVSVFKSWVQGIDVR